MTDKPHVWHYGLIAETWAEFGVETPELPYYLKQIQRFGQPVLDLACGTGRLLLPLLQAGIDIDGCDISPDMLRLCREKAKPDGLNPRLFQQPMHELDLPRSYRMIYICGSFGLAGSRQFDQATLEQCHEHLEEGGALVLNIEAEYAFPVAWQKWLKDQRQEMPEPWPEEGKRRRTAAGAEYVSRSRMLHLDPLEQSYTRQMRVEKWLERQLIAQEERTLQGQMYFMHEVVLMLEKAGFGDILVQGDYREETISADHSELVFVART
ncbi:MAG: class I SAM-dependent methyltransferase [Candidatus Promineifilaceae bacterium]